jgi:hypothetical protein
MTADFVDPQPSLDGKDDPATTAFREVIAYLRGVADTVAAHSEHLRPLSLMPATVRAVTVRPVSVSPLSMPASTLPPALLQSFSLHPVSLSPDWGGSLRPANAEPGNHRITLRLGEAQFESASAWPDVAIGSIWEPARGGARLIDPGSIDTPSEGDVAVIWRRTLPYGAPTISVAASSPSLPLWTLEERASEIRRRPAELPREWYELTGTEPSRPS